MSKEEAILTSVIEEATKSIKGAVEQALEASRGVTSQVAEKAEEVMDHAQDVVSEQIHQGKRLVKKHPLEAMLIGFGVGCLVGVCLTRKK
jgi:ElaB/YqjD/DUF883 family membrane-anchored ribosome-binding protein